MPSITYFRTIIAFRGSGSRGSWKGSLTTQVPFAAFPFKSFAKLFHGHFIVYTYDVIVPFTTCSVSAQYLLDLHV